MIEKHMHGSISLLTDSGWSLMSAGLRISLQNSPVCQWHEPTVGERMYISADISTNCNKNAVDSNYGRLRETDIILKRLTKATSQCIFYLNFKTCKTRLHC